MISRGVRSFAVNDLEKMVCSEVPKISGYPGVVQTCQDAVTPK